MRIAFYAPMKPPNHPVASGDRAMARALIAAMEAAGHQPQIASYFRSYDAAGNSARQDRLRKVGRRMADRYVYRTERSGERPHIWFTYHLYHKAPDWLGPTVADRLRIPYVVAEASFAPKQAGGPWDLGHRAAADAIRRADLILQPNPADAECVMPLLPAPDRLVAFPPFLNSAPFRSPDRKESRAAVGQMLRLDTDVPWLLAVAMMRNDQKLLSYRCLAEALSRLTELPWRLLVAGAGAAEAEVRSSFGPFSDRVSWMGMLSPDRLRRLYRASDIFLWPAIKEAWGVAILEAQAAGLPVVAGESGGVASVVVDGRTGLLPSEGDPLAFGQAVRDLLLNPARRDNMGRAAEDHVARKHDISVAAALLDRHLRSLVAVAA
jgi:glycosyltransferase involved in cell wall biosynthesis